MKCLRLILAGITSGVLLAACDGGVPATNSQSFTASESTLEQQVRVGTRVCPDVPRRTQCEVLIAKTGVAPDVAGLGPPDFQAAYNLPSASKGSGQIVAIVDTYDNPNVASDLATYRSYYGLPAAKFYKYNEHGQQSNYPPGDKAWGVEIDLDVEMVSATCPNCTIYLIEADPSDPDGNGHASDEAVKLGAHIVSNSYVCYVYNGCKIDGGQSDYDTPGVVYVAAAGDSSYGYENIGPPASLPSVVAVGGTILSHNGSQYKEIVWTHTGAGCATGVSKPAWQDDPGCTSRTENDVAAVAFNVAVYDSYGYSHWMTTDGTSIATPLIAGIYGLAGNATSQNAGKKFWTLTKRKLKKDLHYIDQGSDGPASGCGGSYLCTAGTGQYGTYSGPAGWGTPNGIGAF